VLTLHGPTAYWDASKIRLNVSPEEKKLLIQFSCIMERNAFDMGKGDRALFAQMSCFGHSCAGNCHYSPSANGATMQCRANQHIAAGAELTIAYLPELNLKHTYERRQAYLEKYHFTCHCPRCDALGDDTRQFDCFDPACKGVMMVCQPTMNKLGLPEPYLLPCTVCHRAPPKHYDEEDKFYLESIIPELLDRFTFQNQEAQASAERWRFRALLEDIEEFELPMRHALCLPFHELMLELIRSRGKSLAEVRDNTHLAALAYIAAQEGITPHPCAALLRVLNEACVHCVYVPNMVEEPDLRLSAVQAKELLQRNLRMVLLLRGRAVPHDCVWRAEIDRHLLNALAELPQVCNMEVCAFCEESPLHAALTLSRCGKCRQVCYCSTS